MFRKPILFYGDPHNNWGPLYDACASYSDPGHIVIVGDLELQKPLHPEISDVFDAGWSIHYILGNHDCHGCPQYQHLVDDHPSGHMGGKVTPIAGLQVAGLSGVFKGKVWFPPAAPEYDNRQEWLRRNAPRRWRDGLPVHMLDTIFPEDFSALKPLRADILVSHEGPSSVWKGMGFDVIDGLAKKMGASLIVHGHHHHAGDLVDLPNGVAVKSLGKAEVWELPAEFLPVREVGSRRP